MWANVLANAEEKLEAAKLLCEYGHNTSGFEEGFFAIELILKAFMLRTEPDLIRLNPKKYRNHPWFSHDLGRILDALPQVQKGFFQADKEAYSLLNSLCGDSLAWKPWKRYRYRATSELALKYVNAAEGLQKWMLQTLLKS